MKKPKQTLDFIVIGAQKSATTSLFRYLSGHPFVFMPRAKETNYFSDNIKYARGTDWYLSRYFGSASAAKLWGEASPSYMCFEKAPERIYKAFPNVKLIAILRHPVDRAYSHFRMDCKRKVEEKKFNHIVEELIHLRKINDASKDKDYDYIRLGEYGRILSSYLEFFPKENIEIMFTEDLERYPMREMKRVFSFLGVSDKYVTETFKKKHNVGGKKRLAFIEELMNYRWAKYVGRIIVPQKIRGAIGFWIITKLTTKPRSYKELEERTRIILLAHYKKDIEKLEENFGIKVPWE